MSGEPRYPEHEKLREVAELSQAIGEFLDITLPGLGIALCEPAPDSAAYWPTHRTIPSLLAEHFGIDQAKLDAEKAQMLVELRGGA